MRIVENADDRTTAAAVIAFAGDINRLEWCPGWSGLRKGISVIQLAALSAKTETIAALSARGDVDPYAGAGTFEPWALQLAADNGATVKALLSAFPGVDVDYRTELGVGLFPHNNDTALHWAARMGNTDTVATLLAAGANPFAETMGGRNVEQIARLYGHKHVADMVAAHVSYVTSERQMWLRACVSVVNAL